jgi:hypothetical protein
MVYNIIYTKSESQSVQNERVNGEHPATSGSEKQHPDFSTPELLKSWADEARKRWQAYREGREKTVSYARVMAKYRRKAFRCSGVWE